MKLINLRELFNLFTIIITLLMKNLFQRHQNKVPLTFWLRLKAMISQILKSLLMALNPQILIHIHIQDSMTFSKKLLKHKSFLIFRLMQDHLMPQRKELKKKLQRRQKMKEMNTNQNQFMSKK